MVGMHRELLLVRHVKSAWDDPSLADHDRPVAPRGVKALRHLRDYLKRTDYRPDVVLCSSSRRTVDTLDGIRAALPNRASIEVADELYLANADTLLARLQALDDTIRCAMVVGHNPAIEDLAQRLVGSGDTSLRCPARREGPYRGSGGAVVRRRVDGPRRRRCPPRRVVPAPPTAAVTRLVTVGEFTACASLPARCHTQRSRSATHAAVTITNR